MADTLKLVVGGSSSASSPCWLKSALQWRALNGNVLASLRLIVAEIGACYLA